MGMGRLTTLRRLAKGTIAGLNLEGMRAYISCAAAAWKDTHAMVRMGWERDQMTVAELKKIIESLPDDTIVYINVFDGRFSEPSEAIVSTAYNKTLLVLEEA